MYELKKIGKVFTSKSVGTGPSSYEKRIYRAAVSQRLRNTVLESCDVSVNFCNTGYHHGGVDIQICCTRRLQLFYALKQPGPLCSFCLIHQNNILSYTLQLYSSHKHRTRTLL